ncbi:RHS repeat protein [Curtobacterium sp. MCBD17_040]|uniref:RHS repeat protein n=1 Tax=Curtobacterium sp. MCBD17_040 TaxID=2175674 RepID=UPI0015E8B49D|nr:RHS repeat protein [Curtobacterium sp. MCBD17_040]WIB65267.1 RHS repeat protein [Curtobacterium sp. MCBD17_040]
MKNTTYTVDATTHDVTKVVDPDGHTRSAKYNAANNEASSSTVGTGNSTSTTTGTYTSNNAQSLNKVSSSAGASSSATYQDSTNPYLPTTTTDGSKNADGSDNTTTVTYDGQGNQSTSSTGADTNVKAKVVRNADGTVQTATAPGNGSNSTHYTYNSDHQLTSVTPPTGTTLGVKNYTYDPFGRLASETDGIAGHTTSYTYDNDDRQLTESFSDNTPTVSNHYDGNGNLTSSASGSGTITNTYDQQNRLTATANTAGGGTVSYGYDKASNETSDTEGGGTATYAYDPAGELTTAVLPNSSGTETELFQNDDHGRRTDTWVNSNADHTTRAAHMHTSYDTSGRVVRQQTWTGTSDTTASLVFDTSYCYQYKTAPASCDTIQAAAPTTTSQANDSSKLQSTTDNTTGQPTSGQTTTYSYTAGRLMSATQSGGASSNVTWTYTYDSNGDRTKANETGSATSSQTLTFNAASQITSSGYSYDGAGNMTASPGVTYTYNAAEQMTTSTTGGATTTYTYAGADQNELLSQSTPGQASYVYMCGKSGQLAMQDSSSLRSYFLDDPVTGQVLGLNNPYGQVGFYLVDGIGNAVGIITDDGQRQYSVTFDPYGGRTVTSGGNSD